ncbi:MAG: hypothetical protein RLZZ450_5518 [Pseudomonadota bacterium]
MRLGINVRFLLFCLLLGVGLLVWRACASPTQRASGTAEDREPTLIAAAGDAGRATSVELVRTNDAAISSPIPEEQGQHVTDAEAVLARIEADRRPGQRDEPTDALEIRALVSLTRIGAAHAKLQHFAEDYPTSSELPALVRLTGYHPRPMDRHAR